MGENILSIIYLLLVIALVFPGFYYANKNKKVFLKTWVKVKKNWNTDSDYLQSLGVGGSYD